MIPVVRGLTPDRAGPLAEALADGGLSVLEVTLEKSGALEAIVELSGSSTIVGAGTVTTLEQAESATDSGAAFLVSPHLDPVLIEWAIDTGIPYLPGVFTPTEMARALAMGVETVKLFPANVAGPDHVSTLLGPFPGVSIVSTGGITADNAALFLARGAVAVGVGGWLTGHNDLELVTRRADALLEVV